MPDSSSRPFTSITPEPFNRFSEPPALDDDGLDLHHYWYLLRKRQRLIGVFFLSVVVTVGLFSYLATPIYTAETVLLIERSPLKVINIEAVSKYRWMFAVKRL